MRRSVSAAAVLAVLGLGTGCGTPPGEDEVVAAARQWEAAAEAADAGRLCALLTPAAAESAATGDETCERAVGDLHLPGGARVGAVQLWSDEAQVRAGNDTLFLVKLAAGWRVNAAGCTPQRDRPYDCDVEG
ncbi:MAG: hypothetical protein ACJ73E_01915 [Mycobacteriales bacterium]